MDLTKYYPDIAAKYPAYVTQRELCEICRICPKTAYNLEQQGEIPYTIEQNHLIRSHKIKLTDILAYLYRRECRQEADSPYICAMRTFYDKHLSPYSDLLSGTHSFERRIDLKESPIKTERKTLHLPEDTVRALNKLAAKNGTDFSKEVRRAIDEYLDLETTAENIDMINGVIRQELSGQLKALGNRLAGLINRLTIISAAGYYANIAIIADLIDQDRYSSFEKIESAARKRALAFANQKNADALRTFMDDEEMQKAIHAVQGGSRVDSDL